MSESKGPKPPAGSGEPPEPDAPDPALAQPQKQIEKVKADNEKLFKPEFEKPPKRELKDKDDFKELKNEKLEKPERKEHKELKNEKFEKPERKEIKDENKELKNEIKEFKPEKEIVKEGKREIEKPPAGEGQVIPDELTLPIEREGLAQHADALEEAARQLRHFIESSERPDLSRGALRDEPDEHDKPDKPDKPGGGG